MIKFLKIVHLYIVVVGSPIKENNLFSFLFQHSIVFLAFKVEVKQGFRIRFPSQEGAELSLK